MLPPADLAGTYDVGNHHGPSGGEQLLDFREMAGSTCASQHDDGAARLCGGTEHDRRHLQSRRHRKGHARNRHPVQLRGRDDFRLRAKFVQRTNPRRLRHKHSRLVGGHLTSPLLGGDQVFPEIFVDALEARLLSDVAAGENLVRVAAKSAIDLFPVIPLVKRAAGLHVYGKRTRVTEKPATHPLDGRRAGGLLPAVGPRHVRDAVAVCAKPAVRSRLVHRAPGLLRTFEREEVAVAAVHPHGVSAHQHEGGVVEPERELPEHILLRILRAGM